MTETPSQTVGPFLSIGLTWPVGRFVVPSGTEGAITIRGVLFDGNGEPVTDGLVETWQADPDGRFNDPSPGIKGFTGFGRCATDVATGAFEIVTVRPGPIGDGQAPHVNVSVFARGLLDRVVTRIYFPDEERANAADPLLSSLPPERAATLVAHASRDGRLDWDVHLQGERETVFLAL